MRSRLLAILIFLFALCSVCAMGSDEENAAPSPDGYILIAYFSWAENNDGRFAADAAAASSLTRPGNVEDLALFLDSFLEADLFSIQVEDPYPASWDECLERANDERREGVHPSLISRVENIEEYEIVFIGYPNWWYGIPMALYTFFEENNLAGKDVYLFCSHGTGGLARSVEQIEEAIPESNIVSVFDINEHRAHTGSGEVRTWLSELGFIVRGE